MFTVNIADKMTKANAKALARDEAILAEEAKMQAEVSKLIEDSRELAKSEERVDLVQTLGLDYHVKEATRIHGVRAKWSHLPQERIFTLGAIRETCVKYGLRFLPTEYYKGSLDEGIGAQVEELKRLNGGKLPADRYDTTRFYIAAPASSFVLQARPKDPLLFCDLGNNHFYLVHKWGTDLAAWRRVVYAVLNRWYFYFPPVLLAMVAGAAKMGGMARIDIIALTFCVGVVVLMATIITAIHTKTPAEHWDDPFED